MSTDMCLQETARRTPYIPRDVLESRYHSAKKRLFFFDYDVCSFLPCLFDPN
jgi:trehalose-6-phosphatase